VKSPTLGAALRAAATTLTGLTFVDLRDRETSLSYVELYARSREIAGGLTARGIRPGDRVALVLPTSPEFVETFFGTILAGAIPVPLYPPLRLGRLEEFHRRTAQMLTVAGAKVLISDDRVRGLLGRATDAARPPLGCLTVADLRGRGEFEYSGVPQEIALIQFSSGTTVDSKPVALSHANVLSNVAAIDAYIFEDASPNPAGVSWLPLYHDMGLIGALIEAVYRPGNLTLIPPEHFLARPALWLRAISRHRATISPAPNFAYGLCTKRIRDEELDGVDLSTWSLALNGAEPVTAAVLQRFADRFARWGFRAEALTPVYGLSEASLAVTFKPVRTAVSSRSIDADALASDGIVRPGDRTVVGVGRPLAGIEVEIRGDDGAVLPAGRAGRIFVRGPSVMTGYFGRPEATAETVRDGWLETGDIGFEQDGELFICGRVKELVILHGANHAPHEFEEALEGLAGVRAGCAVAVGFLAPDGSGEALALLVETDGEPPLDLVEKIRGQVAQHTGIHPTAVELLSPGTLPRTSSGKLRRREAGRLWELGKLTPPENVNALRIALESAKGGLLHMRGALRRRLASNEKDAEDT
jgi:acyl-CoA synthetase (AMP-forming)/AMP-acid ligase II